MKSVIMSMCPSSLALIVSNPLYEKKDNKSKEW